MKQMAQAMLACKQAINQSTGLMVKKPRKSNSPARITVLSEGKEIKEDTNGRA